MYMTILIGKVRYRSPLHQRKLLKPLASQSALSTVSYWRKESWMEVFFTSPNKRYKESRERVPVVYTDKTWANAHDGLEKTWVKHDDTTGVTK